MKRPLVPLLLLTIFLTLGQAAPLHAQSPLTRDEITWIDLDANGELRVHLYFFWSKTCPHCQEAHPFIVETLPTEFPWLALHSLELTENPANGELYASMATALGGDAMYVPGFFYCGVMSAGYGSAETTGAEIKQRLTECHAQALALLNKQQATPQAGEHALAAGAATHANEESPAAPATSAEGQAQYAGANGPQAPDASIAGEESAAGAVSLPLVGEVNAQGLPLPFLTLVIAGADAFNPCAFFVLLFLLSLMVRSGSRSRMLLIGGVFVFVSGLLYFLFMAAWLNVFRWIGELTAITFVAGLIAIGIALINIKDYFWYKQGVSLTIPDSAKPGLYARTRDIVGAGSLPAMLLGAGALAIAANTYELLCTFGFPMVYTRILTMHDLPSSTYYLYLLTYNVIYVIPLLLIVLGFSVVLESRRLTEREGRVLKLLSGFMMLLLGMVLVFVPELLNQVGTAVLLLSGAILLTLVIVLKELALKLVSGTALLLLIFAYVIVPALFEQLAAALALLITTLLLTFALVWLDRRRHPSGRTPLTGGVAH